MIIQTNIYTLYEDKRFYYSSVQLAYLKVILNICF